jgi:hypothetical protein
MADALKESEAGEIFGEEDLQGIGIDFSRSVWSSVLD